MSKLKDKLSANMRNVKANQQAPAAETTQGVSDKHSVKPAAAPASKPAPAPAGGTSSSGDVPPSGSALFPSRVWPD